MRSGFGLGIDVRCWRSSDFEADVQDFAATMRGFWSCGARKLWCKYTRWLLSARARIG